MNIVLDIYDDPTAGVLRGRLGLGNDLPEKLASLQVADPAELQRLPDRLFALVATYGDQKLRKYAMHNAAQLATSIAYFLECGHALPADTRTKVATNLVNACAWYDEPPPEALVKVALGAGAALTAGLGIMEAPSRLRKARTQNAGFMESIQAAQASGVKQASGVVLEDGEEAWQQLERCIRGEEPKQRYDSFNTGYPNPFADAGKEANLTGTEVMAQGALSKDPRTTPQSKSVAAPKVSSWQHCGDLTGALEPRPKVAKAEHYALPHRKLYPIDTPEQIKKASAYFDEFYRDFTPADRRIFACSVDARAAELGVEVAGTLSKFAGEDYGPYIRNELERRVRAFEGTDKVAGYQVLLEKQAEVPPIVMYDMLDRLDQETGVARSYGRPVTGFMEPLQAVFGKTASEPMSWSGGGHYVNQETLERFASKVPDLDKLFGEGYSKRFRKDPVKSFLSLSDSQKVVLSRLANSVS